jgi:hypothetical protein
MPIHRVLATQGRDFTHREMKNIIRRLYRFFETHPEKFKIGKLYGLHGHIYYNVSGVRATPERIDLDYRKEFIPTLIHECLHNFYPHAEEDDILALEKKIVKELTERQVKAILRKFVQHVCK